MCWCTHTHTHSPLCYSKPYICQTWPVNGFCYTGGSAIPRVSTRVPRVIREMASQPLPRPRPASSPGRWGVNKSTRKPESPEPGSRGGQTPERGSRFLCFSVFFVYFWLMYCAVRSLGGVHQSIHPSINQSIHQSFSPSITQPRHGGGVGPQGSWIYIYLIYIKEMCCSLFRDGEACVLK